MIIRVIQGSYSKGESGEHSWNPATEVYINPDSPIKLIYYYIQQAFKIDYDFEWDICDENGNLVYMYDKDPWINGLNYLTPKSTYYVVLFQRDDDNRLTNPMIYLHDSVKKTQSQWSEFMGKIKKQMNPSTTRKPSRISKTRSSTSNAKQQGMKLVISSLHGPSGPTPLRSRFAPQSRSRPPTL